MIALLGNLSRDVFPGAPSRAGGAPYHVARALQHVSVPATIYARCAREERDTLLPAVAALGTSVRWVEADATASFEIVNTGDSRRMRVLAAGATWTPGDLPSLPEEVRWVHVAPLSRPDFPAATLAALARGRRIAYDGQGLVRTGRLGALELDAAYDPDVLRHVWALKLSDEEAAVLGDPGSLPVRELLLTHGSRGSTIHAGGTVTQVPAHPIDADPTGAGDCYLAAYVAGRSLGLRPADAARRATAVVATVLAEG